MGLMGLEAEREWSGTSLLLNVGGFDRPVNLVLIGRRYSSGLATNRTFFDLRVGILGLGSGRGGRLPYSESSGLGSPFVGVGFGYEMRLFRALRVIGEAGVGLINPILSFTPITQAGVFFGISVGWSF